MNVKQKNSGNTDNVVSRLQKVLDHMGWKQKDLAEAIGVTQKTVTCWMRHKHPPSKAHLRAVAGAAGVSYEWLSNDHDEGPMLEKKRWAWEFDRKRLTHQEIMAIYEQLESVLAGTGQSRENLAAAAGLHLYSGPEWLGDRPRGEAIDRISKATGYDRDWIATGQGVPKRSGLSIAEETAVWSPVEKELDEMGQNPIVRYLLKRISDLENEVDQLKKQNPLEEDEEGPLHRSGD